MKTNFCDQIDNVQRLLQAYRRLRARSWWTRSVFWWWRDGRDTARRTRSAGGQRGTAAPMYGRARRGLPDACCKLCSDTWDAHIRPAMPGACMARAAELLVAARERAEEASEDYALIIDEADLIARQRVLTETVQELGDLTGHPIVLVGNADLASRLDMHLGFSRRIWELVEFRPATIRDVGNLAHSLCRYRIADDLAAWLCKASGGRICALERSLRRIERHCAGQAGREPDLSGGHGGAGIGAGQDSQTDPRAQPAA